MEPFAWTASSRQSREKPPLSIKTEPSAFKPFALESVEEAFDPPPETISKEPPEMTSPDTA